jgi:adenylate cyclase
LVATTAALLLLGIGLWVTWPRPLGLLIDLAGVSGPPIDPPLPDKPSIVVLPFANMSADPEQEYFSDGITEDLTTALAGNRLLFVISRNSAFTYKGMAVKVEDVGRELGVRYVLEGSVRKAGDRVRITAQLVDATSGGHLWSQRYDRDLSDIFALQSEMAQEILVAVGVEIGAAEAQRLARKPTESLTAVDAVWKGIYLSNRINRKDNEEAGRLLERAIDLDPSFANAHALLGVIYASTYGNGWSSDPGLIDRAEELGRRAIELDPSGAYGHGTIAWVNIFRDNSSEAVAAADRAIERLPNFEFAHAARGIALVQDAQFLEATRSIRQALRLNPRAPTALLVNVALVNYAAGRMEEAVEMLERVRAASSDLILARIVLGAHYEREGQHDRASAAIDEILRVRADFTAQDAIDLTPQVESAIGSEEFAQLADVLRKAGLP